MGWNYLSIPMPQCATVFHPAFSGHMIIIPYWSCISWEHDYYSILELKWKGKREVTYQENVQDHIHNNPANRPRILYNLDTNKKRRLREFSAMWYFLITDNHLSKIVQSHLQESENIVKFCIVMARSIVVVCAIGKYQGQGQVIASQSICGM